MSWDSIDWTAVLLFIFGGFLGFERWKGRRENSESTVTERMATAKERHIEDIARLDKELADICKTELPQIRARQHQLAGELQLVNIKIAIIETRLGGSSK